MQFKRAVQEDVDADDNEPRVGGNVGDATDRGEGNIGIKQTEDGKVVEFESDYIDSSNPGSYEETSSESDADDATRHRSKKNYFNHDIPLPNFSLDLGFKGLKQFKSELVDFSTKHGFEFR